MSSPPVVLMKSDPFDAVKAIELSKATVAKMTQNLWWAVGYNTIAVPIAAVVDLAPDLPHRVTRLLGELERGQVTITVKHAGLEDALKELERVTMGVITAALIVGLSFVMTYYHPPGWEVLGGIVFAATFLVALMFAARLLWVIWRTGRR